MCELSLRNYVEVTLRRLLMSYMSLIAPHFQLQLSADNSSATIISNCACGFGAWEKALQCSDASSGKRFHNKADGSGRLASPPVLSRRRVGDFHVRLVDQQSAEHIRSGGAPYTVVRTFRWFCGLEARDRLIGHYLRRTYSAGPGLRTEPDSKFRIANIENLRPVSGRLPADDTGIDNRSGFRIRGRRSGLFH